MALGGLVFLSAVGALVDTVDVVHTYGSAGLGVGHGFLLLGALATAGAGVSLGSAFLSPRHDRASGLHRAGLMFAGGSAAMLIGSAVAAGDYAAHHFPGAFSASWLASAVAAAAALAASVIFASAYRKPLEPTSVHERRLGSSAGVAALAALLSGVNTTLLLVAYVGHYLPAGLAGGLGVETAGNFVLAGALVIGAGAFWRLRIRPSDIDLQSGVDRDAVLTLAVAVAASAYLLIAAGDFMQVADANVLLTGHGIGSTWLSAVQGLGWCAAFGWGAVGLYRASRDAS